MPILRHSEPFGFNAYRLYKKFVGFYCAAKKVGDQQISAIRNSDRKQLTDAGFTFIKLLSLEYPEVRGYAIFFEGHLDEMNQVLKSLERGY